MREKNIYFFIGTNAELIKLAPVIRELENRRLGFKIIASMQNTLRIDELKPIFGKLEIYHRLSQKPVTLPINIYLKFLIWIIKAVVNFSLFFRKEFTKINKKNSFFIVHGDTVSALIGAIVAKILNVKLVHIESGYRSFNFLEPFPEEICRYLVSHLSDVLFCPNEWCLKNVKNFKAEKINTGLNTVYESCMEGLKIKHNSTYLKSLSGRKFFILILHRQEHMLFQKKLTIKYINILTNVANSNLKCVFILHPITENFLKKHNLLKQIRNNPNIITLPRIPYLEFMKILNRAEFIATDGGSNQQEACYLGIPCLLLRKYTEQTEGLGINTVLAKDNQKIVRNFLSNYRNLRSKKISVKIPPSRMIVDYFINH